MNGKLRGGGSSENFIPLGKPPSRESREFLPAVEVDNEVVWVNDEVRMPFNIVEGEHCNLGLFLTQNNDVSKPYLIEMMKEHTRSGLFGRVVFQDNDGRMYRDVNLKGIGTYIYGGANVENMRMLVRAPARGMHDTPNGLCDWGYAERDREKSEYFLERGLRTHRTLAILRLNEIVVADGERISIAEARKRGILYHNEEPVIQVRAFGTQARIDDADSENDYVFLEDAMHLVAQELHVDPEDFSVEDYIRWFAKTLGEQMAILHTHKHYHNYVSTHNITLDCRLTDFDSVGKLPREGWGHRQKAKGDVKSAASSLRTLHRECRRFAESREHQQKVEIDFDALRTLFYESYREHLDNPKLSGKKSYRKWLKRKSA